MNNISSSRRRSTISKKNFVSDKWQQDFIRELITKAEQEEEMISESNLYNTTSGSYVYPIKEVRVDKNNEWLHKSYRKRSRINYNKYNIMPQMPQDYYGYNPISSATQGFIEKEDYMSPYPRKKRGSIFQETSNRVKDKTPTIINNYYTVTNPTDIYHSQRSTTNHSYYQDKDDDVIDSLDVLNSNKKDGFFKRLKNVFLPNSNSNSNPNKAISYLQDSQDYSVNRYNRRLARIKERYVEKQARVRKNPNVYLID